MLLCDLILFPRGYNDVESILLVSFGIYIANLLLVLLLYNAKHVEFDGNDQIRTFYRPNLLADSGKHLTSAWKLFTGLMNAHL